MFWASPRGRQQAQATDSLEQGLIKLLTMKIMKISPLMKTLKHCQHI